MQAKLEGREWDNFLSQEGLALSFLFGSCGFVRLLAFLWPSFFVSPMMVPTIVVLLDLNYLKKKFKSFKTKLD
jgi:hypothetical protein